MKHEELTEKLKEINSALGKEDVIVCVFKGDEDAPSILMHGRKGSIIASLGFALMDDDFRNSIMAALKVNLLAKIFGTEEDKENAQQEADRIAKDFLRNNGFKMEGE